MLRRKIMILLSLLSLIAACSSQEEKQDAHIEEGELTDYERSLTDLVSENSFVYDVEIFNEDAKEVLLKVDYYQEGELVNSIVNLATTVDVEEPEARFVFLNTSSNGQEKWITAAMTENGMASSTVDEGLPKIEDMSGMAGSLGGTSLELNKEAVIGSIVKSNEETISTPVNIETDEDLKKATSYEHVFILTATLMDCHIGDEGCTE
ncbi:hypothetical protein BN988_01358 [Oceanobacillus picturae]|uniref:Lipoprotein n=1 Tax=Oceanobacillus picturae TaxID=171693 RepID=W9ABL2_9BACI|nr:hypothetical protein [Oceanobacillus picturae]CDO02878.1 hypothetical protein BN988_01358 [Oceanobacillus picturae]